jgi:hypothetical protein
MVAGEDKQRLTAAERLWDIAAHPESQRDSGRQPKVVCGKSEAPQTTLGRGAKKNNPEAGCGKQNRDLKF